MIIPESDNISEMRPNNKNNQIPTLTPEEYFTWEETQTVRHEYLNGEVCAMSGGTINHSDISGNILALLKAHLRRRGCKVLNSDARVNIVETTNYVYPDLSVTCDERDQATPQYITYPCLVVEVLSAATEAYDRGNKFKMYRRNPSLKEYVLVNAESIGIEIFRRTAPDTWQILNYQAGDVVELASVELTFPIEAIYEDIVF